ncbi:hypothetical protein [Bacillus toyonensis]|nr:hypothetical protein [Bacillus toyonensis]
MYLHVFYHLRRTSSERVPLNKQGLAWRAGTAGFRLASQTEST